MPDNTASVEPLADRMPRGDSAEQVADSVFALWQEVDQALHPIIGHGGVAALFNRSLMLTSSAHPWMSLDRGDALSTIDLTALRGVLARQSAADAAAGGRALFAAFEGLITSLVGPALTERLLLPVRRPRP